MQNKRPWIIFSLCAALSIVVWLLFSYQQMTFVTLTVDRNQALKIATDYVATLDPTIHEYQHAIIFKRGRLSNRYLQKTIGFEELKKFIDNYNLDLFFWNIRYFKEGLKEQFFISVSSRTGQIISYNHTLDATEAIDTIPKNEARENGIAFLKERFGFDVDQYMIKGDLTTIYDFREDHTFAWQHKNVMIPWKEESSGTGKLISSIRISGDEVLSFSNHAFNVPEDFKRHLASQGNISANLSIIVKIFYMILFTSSIYYVVVRRNHLAMHTTKKFYIVVAGIVFTLSIVGFFNQYEPILASYPTTSPFKAYIIRFFINALVGTLLGSFALLMPGLAGELLHFETFKNRRQGSFLRYLHSTFLSREVAKSVFLGYLICIILLGLQSLLLKLGQTFFNVWVEYSWMTSLTTSYLPFLAAITLGFKASFTEEILYRVYAISLGKKIFKRTLLAVVLSSILWGFAHSTYPVYPMWFRALEVSCLGFFISYIYLEYGLICVLVAHFVFDAFWHSTGYLFGQVQPFYLVSSAAVLALPLLYGLCAFFLDRKVEERPMRWYLNKHQQFNLKILKSYLFAHKDEFGNKPAQQVRDDISENGWDIAVVDVAVEDFFNEKE